MKIHTHFGCAVIFLAVQFSAQNLAADVLWSNSFDYPAVHNGGLDPNEVSTSSQYAGMFAKEIVLRSAKLQHRVTGNSLTLLDHPEPLRSGAIRFMNSDASARFDLASGDFGSEILASGGFELSFDWTPSDKTDRDWIALSAGIRASTADTDREFLHGETDMGVLLRNNGQVQTRSSLGVTDSGNFPPSTDVRRVVVRFAFDSFADGERVILNAWVDGLPVVTDRTQNWGARGANRGKCFLTLENWNTEPQDIDNLSIRTFIKDNDGDLLPDKWEKRHGLSSDPVTGGQGENGSSGDPDGDGYSNYAEYNFGTNPSVSDDLSGKLAREVWLDIPGQRVSQLLESSKFLEASDLFELTDGAVMPSGYADNYGQRVRGWITAPSSGEYTFWISGDDQCELWLSENDSKFTKKRIASVPKATSLSQWDKYPSQQSLQIRLVAGQRYFMEILHKEGGFADGLAVAWQVPGGTGEIIPSRFLTPYAGDPDDEDMDELPDSWEIAYFGSTEETPMGNPDGDFAPNWEEYLHGSDPTVVDSNVGYWSVERWSGVLGESVSKLLESSDFYSDPTSVEKMSESAIKSVRGFFGSRVRGYVQVEKTAEYRFWISAKNSADLYLSTDETPYLKQSIARIDTEIGTGHGISSDSSNLWDVFASQMSEPVLLEAGQKYYLEVLHQNGHGVMSHTQVAWAPVDGRRGFIPPRNLSSFAGQPGDADDDSLPDDWEIQFGLDPSDNGYLDIVRQGERGDFDSDGLSNRDEYIYGTDPSKPDSDDDGISDSDEIRAYKTDPNISDAPAEELVGNVNIANYTAEGEPWTVTSQGLISPTFRGQISWEFEVPEDGFWLLNVGTSLIGNLYSFETVNVEVAINGVFMGTIPLEYGRDRDAALRILTPFLTAGSHSLSINSTNLIARRAISFREIGVFRPLGADLDDDRTPDWVTSLLFGGYPFTEPSTTGSAILPYLPESRTSPAFLEGNARIRAQATINGMPVLVGVDENHWYTDLELDPQEPTEFTVGFEPGISRSGFIEWQETNVLESESLVIRKNDSLKLVALPGTGSSGQSVFFDLPVVNHTQDSLAKASQSTTAAVFNANASLAIDGNTDGEFNNGAGSVSHTRNTHGSWWEVDLGKIREIASIHIWNRSGSTKTRLSNFRVSVMDDKGETVIYRDYYTDAGHVEGDERWDLVSPVQGKVVRIELLGINLFGDHVLSLAEVEVLQTSGSVSLPSDAESFQYQFTQSGTHLIHANHSDGSTGTLTVTVKQAEFSSKPQNLLSNYRSNINFDAAFVDSSLYFDGGRLIRIENPAVVNGNTLSLQAAPGDFGKYNMVARLYEEGPIVGAQALSLTAFADVLQSGVTNTSNSDFADQIIVRSPIVVTDLPDGGKVVINIFRSGVSFLDGSKNLILRADDFVNGIYNLEILMNRSLAGGYCHHISVYDKRGNFLGRR